MHAHFWLINFNGHSTAVTGWEDSLGRQVEKVIFAIL